MTYFCVCVSIPLEHCFLCCITKDFARYIFKKRMFLFNFKDTRDVLYSDLTFLKFCLDGYNYRLFGDFSWLLLCICLI